MTWVLKFVAVIFLFLFLKTFQVNAQSDKDSNSFIVELQATAFPLNDGLGLYGTLGFGYQFKPFLGLGLNGGFYLEPSFLAAGYSGVGVCYNFLSKWFYFSSDLGMIIKYIQTDDYCSYEYLGKSGLYTRFQGGVRLGWGFQLGVLCSYVPQHVKMNLYCPNVNGDLVFKEISKEGFTSVMPVIGFRISIPGKAGND